MLDSETQRCHPSRLPIGKRKGHPKEREKPAKAQAGSQEPPVGGPGLPRQPGGLHP